MMEPTTSPLSQSGAAAVSHSRLGIASLATVFLACCGTAVGQGTGLVIGFMLGMEGYSNYADAIQRPEFSQYAAVAGVLGLCQLAALPLAVIGLLMGIGGIFEPNRRKEAAIAGSILNGIILLLVIILIVLGVLVMMQ